MPTCIGSTHKRYTCINEGAFKVLQKSFGDVGENLEATSSFELVFEDVDVDATLHAIPVKIKGNETLKKYHGY